MSPRDVIVVGAGVGGLSTAIRLAVAGHAVTVLERLDVVGGKLATYRRQGYVFDVGPSLLTLPDELDELFALAGHSLTDELSLVRLDPQFRYHWPDGSMLEVGDDSVGNAERFERFSAGAGAEYESLLARSREIWALSRRTFLAGPMSGVGSLLRRMDSPRDLLRIDGMRTLADAGESGLSDPRLRQWLGRYATYSGSSPYRAPATLACILALEADGGAWYVRGGLGEVREAILRVAIRVGVRVETGREVTSVRTRGRRVVGVECADGSTLDAPVVVVNSDAEHLYRDLLPHRRRLRAVRRAGRSTSGVVVLVGARGQSERLAHHNVWFSSDYRAEFADLEDGRLPDDPTIYACVSSVTDISQAPVGCENWFILLNAPVGLEVSDVDGERVLEVLARRGVDLRGRAQFVETIGPRDLERRWRAPGGAIYGTSSNGRRAAFRRPTNRGPRHGLYLVGGSTHPGGGLPMVVIGSRIVANLVAQGEESRPER